ncbi:hypothetical protein BJY52DRAFT_888853 [Lactarius psammicola]|nr:hypothetical protein BJY52DRAFT_888853 [Lactarius psammicola]
MIHLLVLLFSPVQHGRAQQTLFPAAIPLAVRSPYLSSWYFTTSGSTFGRIWPTISAHRPDSTTNETLGIPVHVRVDNITYSFLGLSPSVDGSVNLTNTVITPTQTKLTAQAGPMQFNLTFLNPIEPGDWVKQSIPFSYLSLTAESLDGAAHAVQVYSDVSGEWLSGDKGQEITWKTPSDNNVIYHVARLVNQAVFDEINTQAEWGTLYYAMKSGDKITYKTGRDGDARALFRYQGTLDNLTDSNFRPINSNYPVFAISRDLGTIQATQDPVVWAVGFTTDPAIQYTDLFTNSPQHRSLFYRIRYPDDISLVSSYIHRGMMRLTLSQIPDFLNDFVNATSRAQQLDSEILQDAAAVSGALGDLVSLATAQVYGSIQLTIGFDASNNPNKSDVMAFMKDVGGSNTNTNRVNAVETLYSAFPAFMRIDPKLGGLLLEPLFQFQASLGYPYPYAAADLGVYPNVTVSNLYDSQSVEQSGNMLIMTYAHARATGDGSLISRYYSLLTYWADQLSSNTLYTTDETSADGLTINNQTNLAIKGIIAIKAMSNMSSAVNQTANADKYSNTAASLYSQWKSLALDSDQHLLAAYGLANSWTLGYNLFADVWLGTGVVESSVYDSQSRFIDNLALTSSFSNYGLPVDNYSTDTSSSAASSWTLFVAAMTSNQDLSTNLISRVHNRASSNTSMGVFPVYYDSSTGATYSGRASPAQGAMYAPLALKVPVLQIAAGPVATGTSSRSKSHIGAIVGGAIGGVAALLAIGAIALVARGRRRRRRRPKSIGSSSERDVIGPELPMIVTPFDPTLAAAAELETGSQTNWRQRWTGHEPEIVPLIHASTSSDSPVPSLRTVPIPIGLSGKELARLREDNSRSQSTDALPFGPSSTAIAEQDAVTSSSEAQAQRFQLEVESLRREMQELRAERFEAPPGYEDGGAD